MKYILVSVTVTPTVRFTIKARCAVNLTPAVKFCEILNRFKFLQQTLQLGIIFIHIPQQAYINISQKKRKKKPKVYLFIYYYYYFEFSERMSSSYWTEILLILNLSFVCLLSSATQVDYDANAIIINGERRVIFSGAIHYPRSTSQVLQIINLQFLKSLAFSHFLLLLNKKKMLLRFKNIALNFFFLISQT
ncbi:hypothetical protein WN944_006867 [Citrus x changshan-huyou]|uniref:Beta-galactosidase n=1 Tax=Citrus x changshan-huyou TaxID=2935761 RepID=A0AAP0MML5_9ROSI